MDKYATLATKTPPGIKEALHRALSQIGINYPSTEIQIEHPAVEKHGDYSSNISMVIFSNFKDQEKRKINSAHQLAEQLVHLLKKDILLLDLVKEVTVAGPGFVNFFIKTEILVQELFTIQAQGQHYGTNSNLKDKKIMVEFTDPNPFKEFHIGHLYSNIVGETLCRLFESQSAIVWRVNYQGDVGMHVAKSIWGMEQLEDQEPGSNSPLEERASFLGKAYALGATAFKENPTAKEEIVKLNKLIYKKDKSIIDRYNKGRLWSLDYFETIYKKLGTNYKKLYFESESGQVGLDIVTQNIGKLFLKSKGAVIFPGEKFGLHNRVFINSEGLPTYEAKELGLAPTKYRDFPYDQSIIITGNEIDEYFKVLLKALSLISPELASKTKHISHGMVRLSEGKMSSRTGKVLKATDLIDRATDKAMSKIQEETSMQSFESDLHSNQKTRLSSQEQTSIAPMVGMGAIKYAFLKNSIGKDVEFSFEESVNFHGNSGPYLQYTYARCQSVLSKSKTNLEAEAHKKVKLPEKLSTQNDQSSKLQTFIYSQLNTEELSILNYLYRFPEIVGQASHEYAPSLLCTYLHQLAQVYNSFYNQHQILNADNEDQRELRLQITSAVAQVVQNGLQILGIEVPSKM